MNEDLELDKDAVKEWLEQVFVLMQRTVDNVDLPTLSMGLVSRLLARELVSGAGDISHVKGLGVEADLKKWVAYGLVTGSMDMMYVCDPHALVREYAARKEMGMNS